MIWNHFYLTHMKYGESIGFAPEKMIFFAYCHVLELFILKKIWCATRARVSFPQFHILRTSNFFQKDPKWTSRNFKKEKPLKTLLKSSFMQNFSSSTHFDIFSKKYQDFSGNYFSEFRKILNLSMYFIFKLAKHVHAKFQLSSLYPDGHIFDHFLKKISGFFRETL
jgi:hypothetical protein